MVVLISNKVTAASNLLESEDVDVFRVKKNSVPWVKVLREV